ncbi:hypothetical protein X943_003233 [Babesia divergens]|uniref:Uncharacterized protein n=1 Tax=Babesia divergens TaxID=32595 RepID=A0AAD9GAQ3_BABDI|nr:hypothetical protein X943_003233 [Babesia divergens]
MNAVPADPHVLGSPQKKTNASKPRKRGIRSTTKVENPDGNTKLTTFFEEAETPRNSVAPQADGKADKRMLLEQPRATTGGGESAQGLRKNSSSRKSKSSKKKPLTPLEDIVQFSKFANPAMSSYLGFMNNVDPMLVPMIKPTYARMHGPQPWGGAAALKTPIPTIMQPPPSTVSMQAAVANPFTSLNTLQVPMEPVAPLCRNMSMKMMESGMVAPAPPGPMMPLMTTQQLQTVPVPVLPVQSTSPSVLMESVIPKSKMASRRSVKTSSDNLVNVPESGSNSANKVKCQSNTKVPTNQQAQIPSNGDGAMTISSCGNSLVDPAHSAPSGTPLSLPTVHMVGNNAPYVALDNAALVAPPACQSAMSIGVPMDAFVPSTPALPMAMQVPPVGICMPESAPHVSDTSDIPMQSHIPLHPAKPPKAEQQSVVDEIKQDKEAVTGVQKDKLSAPRILVESFQQVLENKRRRMRNCLTEDCKNLLGEYSKIETPFPSKWINGRKHFYTKDIVNSLLPYHMFYYEQLRPAGETMPEKDYSRAKNEIEELKMKIVDMKVHGPVVQQVCYSILSLTWLQGYLCTSACLEALNRLFLRKDASSRSAPRGE